MTLRICRRPFACVRPLVLARRATLALVAALLLTAGTSPAAPTAAAPVEPAGEQVANLRPEVRLRKLHLVRPDLIQYPLQYDVYC